MTNDLIYFSLNKELVIFEIFQSDIQFVNT